MHILAVIMVSSMTAPAYAVNCDRNPNHHQCDGGAEPPTDDNQDPVSYAVEFHDLWGGSSGVGILTVHDANRSWADYTARKLASGCETQPEAWKIDMVLEQVASGKKPSHNRLTSNAALTVLDIVNTGLDWERYWPTYADGPLDGCFGNGVLAIDFRDISKKREATTEVKFDWQFEVYDDGIRREYLLMKTDWLIPHTLNDEGDQHQLHWSPDGSDIISINGNFEFSRVVWEGGQQVTDDTIGISLLQFWFNTSPVE